MSVDDVSVGSVLERATRDGLVVGLAFVAMAEGRGVIGAEVADVSGSVSVAPYLLEMNGWATFDLGEYE